MKAVKLQGRGANRGSMQSPAQLAKTSGVAVTGKQLQPAETLAPRRPCRGGMTQAQLVGVICGERDGSTGDGIKGSFVAGHDRPDPGLKPWRAVRVRCSAGRWTASVVIRGDLPVPRRQCGISRRARVPGPRRCNRVGRCGGRAGNGSPKGGVPRAGRRLALGRTLARLRCHLLPHAEVQPAKRRSHLAHGPDGRAHLVKRPDRGGMGHLPTDADHVHNKQIRAPSAAGIRSSAWRRQAV